MAHLAVLKPEGLQILSKLQFKCRRPADLFNLNFLPFCVPVLKITYQQDFHETIDMYYNTQISHNDTNNAYNTKF